jgi:hypothetical protein
MRSGDVSVIAPFRYSGLLFALVLGYLLWDEMPNLLAWIGIALLVGSGLTILQTERRRQQAATRQVENHHPSVQLSSPSFPTSQPSTPPQEKT